MKNDIKGGKSLMRSSRVRGVIEHGELARVAAFVINGDAADIWPNDALASRNWAITKLLIECGLRQSELRQLKVDDIDTGLAIVTVERRHNDPDDPRLYEPNAKTFDRKIPMSDGLCDALEDYLMGAGGEVADHSGSPFFFLSHSPRNLGEPISAKTVARAIKDLGEHLSVPDLTPHHLRHSWIQNLADWAIENGVGAAEFERFANHMGGWSYLSKMASEYRGDQITQKAYDAGLQVMEARS
jgi:integrase